MPFVSSDNMIEFINHQDNMLALILRANYHAEGIQFFTPNDFSQQLGYMNRPTGYTIDPHIHRKVDRNVQLTQEVLFIKKGKVKVDFYTNNKEYIQSQILTTGDVILLASGGHGLTMLEESEIIEVKQGPYAGIEDKEIFEPSYDPCK